MCELIRAIGEYRKGDNPRITGYEFHVITLATYVAPKYLLIDKLEELEDLQAVYHTMDITDEIAEALDE